MTLIARVILIRDARPLLLIRVAPELLQGRRAVETGDKGGTAGALRLAEVRLLQVRADHAKRILGVGRHRQRQVRPNPRDPRSGLLPVGDAGRREAGHDHFLDHDRSDLLHPSMDRSGTQMTPSAVSDRTSAPILTRRRRSAARVRLSKRLAPALRSSSSAKSTDAACHEKRSDAASRSGRGALASASAAAAVDIGLT
jgi:hypothetical protein